uniref:Uncharacterized protein n=1 Tax=Lepeophtheirus salmonis TaxID=72036 RepID=A0A0K2UES2_LEPSM
MALGTNILNTAVTLSTCLAFNLAADAVIKGIQVGTLRWPEVLKARTLFVCPSNSALFL